MDDTTKVLPVWPSSTAAIKACPPLDAAPASGRVFRRLDGTEADWKTYLEMKKAKGCQAASFSVTNDLDAMRERMMLRGDLSESAFAVAELRPDHGVIKQTGKHIDHYSLWLRAEFHAIVATLFQPLPEPSP